MQKNKYTLLTPAEKEAKGWTISKVREGFSFLQEKITDLLTAEQNSTRKTPNERTK